MPNLTLRALLIFSLLFSSLAVAQSADTSVDAEGHPWWKHAVFYEVYPRSFMDSNNDGIGDLNGIAAEDGLLEMAGD